MKTYTRFIQEEKTRRIGKRQPDTIYVHKEYTKEAGVPQDLLDTAKKHLPKDHQYEVIKYNYKDGSISFIGSPDFNESPEPIVGDAIKVNADGKLTITKQKKDPQIYHHKWEMVGDDYSGFDVEESKERSRRWREVVAGDKAVLSRIGTKSYWEREVVPKL